MTFTKQHAEENQELYQIAIDTLREIGWKPEPEPEPLNWRELAHQATATIQRRVGYEIIFKRISHQVHRVMAEYRGYKKAEWK